MDERAVAKLSPRLAERIGSMEGSSQVEVIVELQPVGIDLPRVLEPEGQPTDTSPSP